MAQGGRRPLFRTLAFRRVGDLVIVVHADVAPDQQEFEAALPLCRSTEVIGLLVLTKGGALNALQRRQVARVRDGNSWRIAVLSDNRLVRGALTALSWLGVEIRGFGESEVGEAVGYLESRVPPRAAKDALGELLSALNIAA